MHMKDEQSKLAKDLECFPSSQRLLLTDTPLPHKLLELWSLFKLLLPKVGLGFPAQRSACKCFGKHFLSSRGAMGTGV